MSEVEKLLNGLSYDVLDEEIIKFQNEAKELCYELNLTRPSEKEKRKQIIEKLFGEVNGEIGLETSFKCDFGKNIYFKGFAIVNYNCVFLDTNKIIIGEESFIGPNCVLTCINHAIIPEERLSGITKSKPIILERRVWLGANVTVLGGVTIGEGSVIGAGSVVTKSIPAGVIAVGNPCKVLRKITENDSFLK